MKNPVRLLVVSVYLIFVFAVGAWLVHPWFAVLALLIAVSIRVSKWTDL